MREHDCEEEDDDDDDDDQDGDVDNDADYGDDGDKHSNDGKTRTERTTKMITNDDAERNKDNNHDSEDVKISNGRTPMVTPR